MQWDLGAYGIYMNGGGGFKKGSYFVLGGHYSCFIGVSSRETQYKGRGYYIRVHRGLFGTCMLPVN